MKTFLIVTIENIENNYYNTNVPHTKLLQKHNGNWNYIILLHISVYVTSFSGEHERPI